MIETALLTFISFLIIFLVGLWISIGISLIYRKVRTRHLQLIEHTFAGISADYLYPLPGEKTDLVQIQRKFRRIGITRRNPANVQYLQDLMIRTQGSFLGKNYVKLETFYKQIPPYRASLHKLKSRKWYIKARGIREMYEMDQAQYIREIVKERNNKNIFVRREAQIAMVVFLGWESLRFLPYLTREMTLWQQIKIVEKLWDQYPTPNLELLRKTYSSDKRYAHELIMRIIRKFGLQDEVDFIINFIDDDSFDTRESAIYCVSSFQPNDKRLATIKEKFFNIPNTEQQKQLLMYISSLPGTIDLNFYQHLLDTGNDVIKLSAAEILWNNGYIKEVQDFYYRQYTDQPEQELSLLHDS